MKASATDIDLAGVANGGQSSLDPPTPFFLLSPLEVTRRMSEFLKAFPGGWIRYPVKCNPLDAVLRAVHAAGGGFEVASIPELEQVLALGAPAELVLFGAPVKPLSTISESYAAGVRAFVADSADEVSKIAAAAPGAAVYLRIAIDDPSSMLRLSSKFGAQRNEMVGLIRQAKEAGLIPAAVMFHVGSQSTDPSAWARALEGVLDLVDQLAEGGRVPVVDIGGGFPHQYRGPVPSISEIGDHVQKVLKRVPYPVQLVLEPGRALVAGCSTLFTSVIARVTRNDEEWLFLDAGIYNALSEAALPGAPLHFSVRLADRPPRTDSLIPFTLTGPTCDSLDIVDREVLLPNCIESGERLAIDSTGAYSLCLSTSFNGFPPPPVLISDKAAEGSARLSVRTQRRG
jgi:ornithine decarboxylase